MPTEEAITDVSKAAVALANMSRMLGLEDEAHQLTALSTAALMIAGHLGLTFEQYMDAIRSTGEDMGITDSSQTIAQYQASHRRH